MSKRIIKIAVTGGPCGGKSSLLSHIESELPLRGYRVFTVSESATELILGGIRPFDNGMNMFAFQTFVLPTQFFREELYHRAAALAPEETAIIICDRGVLDIKAYVTEQEFHALLARSGRKETEVRDSYDAVIHLVTTADGAEMAYTLSNNRARTETLEQARAMDQRTLRAWDGHSHRCVIDNSTDFEGKIARAMAQIHAMLNENPS